MGAKTKAPPKSLGLPTKPPKISGPKINPQKPHAEFFQALKISRKQTEVWLYCFRRIVAAEYTSTLRIFKLFLTPPKIPT